MLSANEQRAAGADVDREVETLCKQVFDLKTRVETGVQASELAARVAADRPRLDRLGRSTIDLLTTIKQIADKECLFKSVADPWADTTTPAVG